MCSFKCLFFVNILCLGIIFLEAKDDLGKTPIVNIKQGSLSGKILLSQGGKKIYAFLGIPYAKPPVQDLRFQPPQLPTSWEGVRNAKKDGARCPQLSYPEMRYEGEEDCLFLNVYTTKLPNDTEEGQLIWDVVVLLHSGGFTHGAGDGINYCPDILLDRDVVLVTINYRLGALGFLSTGDKWAPGNYGLKDQVDALRWVRRNIRQFSGNPNSVTILGAQAGGASAQLHLLSPLSRGLFHGAISQSGTAKSPWAQVSQQEARKRALKLGKLMDCDISSSEKLVSCLRRKGAEDMVRESTKVVDKVIDVSFPFVPVMEPHSPNDNPFIGEPLDDLMKSLPSGKRSVPWIIGVVSHEGLPQALQAMIYSSLMDNLNSDPESYVLRYLGLKVEPKDTARLIGRNIWNFYLKNETLSYQNLNNLAKMTSDYNYFYGVAESVRSHSQHSDAPIFVYEFSYNHRTNVMSLGVPQGEDTDYLFPNIIAGKKLGYSKKQQPMIDRMLNIVTNFARDGDPTREEFPDMDNLLWPVAESDGFHFVNITNTLTIVSDGFHTESIAFWEHIYDQVHQRPPVKDEL